MFKCFYVDCYDRQPIIIGKLCIYGFFVSFEEEYDDNMNSISKEIRITCVTEYGIHTLYLPLENGTTIKEA